MLHGTMMMQITIWTRLGDQWEHIYIHSSITINCDAIFITRFLVFFILFILYISFINYKKELTCDIDSYGMHEADLYS
jgi:hypothetical protein